MHAAPSVKYSLEFSATLSRWKGKRKVQKHHVQAARRILEDIHFWHEWLGSTMRDATEAEIEDFLGVTVDSRGFPAILDISVDLDPPSKRNRNEITGVISWRSIPTSETALENAVEWRLGDRMSQYGIQNDDGGWVCTFQPQTLTIDSYSKSD